MSATSGLYLLHYAQNRRGENGGFRRENEIVILSKMYTRRVEHFSLFFLCTTVENLEAYFSKIMLRHCVCARACTMSKKKKIRCETYYIRSI